MASPNFVTTVARVGLAVAGLAFASACGTLAISQTPNGAATATTNQAPAKPADAADQIKKGRDLFNNWSCSSCHSLADAGATGHVGPSLDGNAALTEALVKDRVTNGQGPMPAFGGQMTDEEIATIAAYIVQVKAK